MRFRPIHSNRTHIKPPLGGFLLPHWWGCIDTSNNRLENITMPNQAVTVQAIQNTIFTLPGRQPFMLGQDLAAIYETETKYITRAVERNPDRFPDDFVFQLTDEETAALKSQIASSNPELKCQFGTSKLSPMANRANPHGFYQTGANMLSTVLKSPVGLLPQQ